LKCVNLANAAPIMREFMPFRALLPSVQRGGSDQYCERDIMLGYSDSNKDGIFLPVTGALPRRDCAG
jgi:phosphoenolpyruvate carboxylase